MSLKKILVLQCYYRHCACITIIIVRDGKGCTERTMGIGVFSYTLSTHVSARACRIPACLAAEVTHWRRASALCSSLRRHVEAIYLTWRPIILRPSDNNEGGRRGAQKSPRLNISPYFFRSRRAPFSRYISSIACSSLPAGAKGHRGRPETLPMPVE